MKTISVRVPATSANCGPGFDCLGLALQLFNTFTFTPNESATEFTYSFEGLGANLLTEESPKDNLIGMAMEKVFTQVNKPIAYGHIHSRVNIPPARGLGSSSTAIVGGLFLANSFLGEVLERNILLQMATQIEGHPDNVAPAIFGNLCCALSTEGDVKYTIIPLPEKLNFAVVVPEVMVSTEFARGVLPKELDYKAAVANVGYATLLISSLAQGRLENLKVALKDNLHVPYRSQLIPHCDDVFKAAIDNGALGATISGSGSTLIAYCADNTANIAQAMKDVFIRHGIDAESYVIEGNHRGAEIF